MADETMIAEHFGSAPERHVEEEEVQQEIEDYVHADQRDGVDHIDMLEFCYNSTKHSATGFSPFELTVGLRRSTYQQAKDVDVDDFLNLWQQNMTLAQESLTRYKETMVDTAKKTSIHGVF